jgi:hypothetical protein
MSRIRHLTHFRHLTPNAHEIALSRAGQLPTVWLLETDCAPGHKFTKSIQVVDNKQFTINSRSDTLERYERHATCRFRFVYGFDPVYIPGFLRRMEYSVAIARSGGFADEKIGACF